MFNKRLSPMRRICALAWMAGTVSAVLVPMSPADAQSPLGSARVWFYREYSLYTNTNYATVLLNGAVAGSVQPYGGWIYRDVPPGHYHLSAETVGTDVNQFPDVDLAPGQEVYVKILSLPSWAVPNLGSTQRDTYYLRVMPMETARAEMAQRPF